MPTIPTPTVEQMPADLVARMARTILGKLDAGMDIKEATRSAATEVHDEAIAKGWTRAQAHAVGLAVVEVGVQIAAEAVAAVREHNAAEADAAAAYLTGGGTRRAIPLDTVRNRTNGQTGTVREINQFGHPVVDVDGLDGGPAVWAYWDAEIIVA